ncbi:lysine transporter LysE, partial [Flavobacteriaceae bacterium]|nr:lysine transporter LysE [Flavobacteriaceae bacterium]
PIPYQAYMVTTLVSYQWLYLDNISISTYVAGAMTGTFITLYIYILFFDKIKNSKISSQKWMNYSIGIITAVIAITTLINILKTP